MAQFVSDTFTDTNGTNLTAHTGETGATWTRHGFSQDTTVPTISSNLLAINEGTANRTVYYASGTPAGADYTVAVDYTISGSGVEANEIFGPLGRVNTGANTMYAALVMQSAGGARLYRFAAGTGTIIVAAVPFTITASETYRITLDVSGTGATVTVAGRIQRASDSNWLTSSGTWQVAQTNFGSFGDTDATRITAAGKAGFWANGTRPRGNNFSADDTGAASSIPSISTYRRMLARA